VIDKKLIPSINEIKLQSGSGILSFMIKLVLWLFSVGLLFMPAIIAQPAGDDLINPYYLFFETNGSFFETIRVGFEYGTSHKFDIIGQIFFVLHSWLWIQFDYFTGLNHIWFYVATKASIFALVLVSGTYWVFQLLRQVHLIISFWKLLYLVTAVAGATVQIHNSWSNDPVANYPLSGYASAIFSFVVLALLVKHKSSDSSKDLLMISFWASIAILYYQINIALLAAMCVFWVTQSWSKIKGRDFLQPLKTGIYLFLFPAIVVFYGSFITSGKTENYDGTSIGEWTQFPKTTLIGLVGTIPGGGWRRSERYLGSLLFPGWMSFLVLAVLLVILFSFWPNSALQKSAKIPISCVLFLTPALAFWVAVVSIQTVTLKYQNEIISIGHVYNFYAHGHIFAAGAIVLLLLVTLQKSLRWGAGLVCVIAIFGMTQFQINSQLRTNARDANYESWKLLNAFNVSLDDAARCDAWKTWASIDWVEYYEQHMGYGYQQAFKTLHNQDFCSTGTNPIP
jgi:hypothetical protein